MAGTQFEKKIGQPTTGPATVTGTTSPEPPSEILPTRIIPADAQLVYTGDVNGCQRWVSPDQSLVQYRAAEGVTLSYHAWKRTHLWEYWSMGASMTADGENYEAAIIDSNYYMTVPGQELTCEIVKVGESTDRNNNYFDEWQWGVHSQQPERVASFCRAQWHGARFADLVTAGSGCDRYQNDQWPTGFPADWPPLPTGIEVSPGSLTMHINGLGLNTAGTTVVLNHTANNVPVQIDPSTNNHFAWPSGTFGVPGYGQFPVTVDFVGGSHTGTYTTSMRIVAGQQFMVPVTVTVTAKGPPK